MSTPTPQMVLSSRSIILPISTRGIGFAICFIIAKFARLSIRNLHILTNSLYRLSLLQLEIKLMRTMSNHCSRNTGHTTFRNVDLNLDLVRLVEDLPAQYAPIVNIISSIGIMKSFGTTYIPRIANQIFHNNMNDWDPTQVTFSTLRQYVLALADIATPRETRLRFYNHSPIPGAIWNAPQGDLANKHGADGMAIEDSAFPLLQNPDEIMPADYDTAQFYSDFDHIMDSITFVGRKYPKYVHFGRIDFDTNGLSTQLVSNNVEGLHCTPLLPPLPNEEPSYLFNNQPPLTGTVERYWSPECITDPEFYVGSMHLVGELSHRFVPSYTPRMLDVSKQEASLDYVSTIQSLLA